jgi:hypothetical protein
VRSAKCAASALRGAYARVHGGGVGQEAHAERAPGGTEAGAGLDLAEAKSEAMPGRRWTALGIGAGGVSAVDLADGLPCASSSSSICRHPCENRMSI